MKSKTLIRLTFLGALLAWLVFLLADLLHAFSDSQGLPAGIPTLAARIFFAVYVLLAYYNLRLRFSTADMAFTEILWRVFLAGFVSTCLALAARLGLRFMGTPHSHFSVVVNSLLMQLNLALLLNFLLTALVAWRRLILHQKTKWLLNLWTFFIVLLFLLLLYITFSPFMPKEAGFALSVCATITVIVLATRVRWIAYLNFRQKWTALLLLLLTMAYIAYFSFTIFASFAAWEERNLSSSLLPLNSFVIVLSFFVVVYGIFSFLVMIFNLPTSSVLEQKMEEASSFQRLSQSIQTEQSEESVYTILLESSLHAVSADAAWLEIQNQERKQLHALRITEAESQSIASLAPPSPDAEPVYLSHMKGSRYRSLLQVPVLVKGEPLGKLTVLKELPNGFNKEMIRTVTNFTRQAGISIENFRLLEEAFQNERYKEELKIAKEVQKSLLPQKPETDPHFEMQAFSQAADEVGGDYYDTLRLNEYQIAWIIADVSGKGTSAAFHMSQMKGIFHTLGQLKFEPKEFMITANMALKYCLEKNSFISAAYFIIDTQKKQIIYARAGHCPILYYSSRTKTAGYFKDKGTALGMVRNARYKETVYMYEIDYHPGDVMVLYTDGITEAGNGREEFGYDRLSAALRQVPHRSAKEIQAHILEKVYAFSGTANLNDDYTMVIIKFMNQPNRDKTV